jgi:hypothetical protein
MLAAETVTGVTGGRGLHAFHDDCDCVIIVVNEVVGQPQPDWITLLLGIYQAAKTATGKHDPTDDEICYYIRRFYPDLVSDGVESATYPLVNDGSEVPWEPDKRPNVNLIRNKVLERHGDTEESRRIHPRKDKFVGWDDNAIFAAADLALSAPDTIRRFGNTLEFDRQIGPHLVRVQVQTDLDLPEVKSIYPVGVTGRRQ